MSARLTNPNRGAYLDMEATGATADELWDCTGFARCDDCGHLMRAETLVTLPDHRCAQRQQLRREATT
ncbi:hypothetical protein OG552_10705 [Streptomyces sp. NBC_01476]|uniref:hypothetical protein n=1 Tax=Streptomyces sp. NBC_01476 TaxID=2903881 RepID=UPI002E324FE4|nr:hypothetical protein [Streptomyces sp. NBC_01476]